MLSGILLIIVGLLAISPYVVLKRADSAIIFDKVAPYQGWIGLIVAIWGIWSLFWIILGISLISFAPLLWVTSLAAALIELALGFLLGYSLIVKYILSKNPKATAKGADMQAKLVIYQTPLGLIAIGLGIWAIVASFMFHF